MRAVYLLRQNRRAAHRWQEYLAVRYCGLSRLSSHRVPVFVMAGVRLWMCEMLHRQRRTKGEYLLYNAAMGGERASTTRMRRSGKICCECGAMLPPPYLQGERLCGRCGKDCAPKHRVYMQFTLTRGWFCQFLEADLKTVLPRKVTVRDQKTLFEMAERGGFHLSPAGRYSIQKAVDEGRGGIWLELSGEQYAKLKRP